MLTKSKKKGLNKKRKTS